MYLYLKIFISSPTFVKHLLHSICNRAQEKVESRKKRKGSMEREKIETHLRELDIRLKVNLDI